GDSQVEVAQQAKPGQQFGFTLRGNGVITESPGETASGAAQQEQAQPQGADNRASDNRPGGGLGAPIDAPDALQQYRWPILGGFALLLAIGGWIVTKRQTSPSAATASASPAVPSSPATTSRLAPPSATPAAPASKPSMLLEALKEELFQLEVERKQGKITPADYEKAKAALDQTLERALKRQA
ncbi:MAG: hypothetical protein ABSB87_17060, partial [Terriglobales bacterium]